MTPVYGCCVGSWERFNRYVLPQVADRIVIAVSGHNSIADAYNQVLSAVRNAVLNVPALILLHDDLELSAGAEAKLLAPIEAGEADLVGVAGGGNSCGLAWWEDHPFGHQQINDRLLDFGARGGFVEHIEGSVMALSPRLVRSYWFDGAYLGFHGYDEIGTWVKRQGLRTKVVDVDTFHHTDLGFSSERSQQLWQEADARFRKKWGLPD